MQKILLLTIFVISISKNQTFSQNKSKWSVGLGYNLELTDSYSGINNSTGKRTFAQFITPSLYFKKDWYGANFDVDYFNIKYNVNHFYLPFEFIIPDYLKGVILKLGTNIYPIDGKIFSLELNGGLYHAILSNKICNSVTFLTTGELLEKHYIVKKISTTNFYYGATMIFRF
ncbi:hypothetical protein [Tenuifilum thalassicum]|uniref:Uncharacterized protein n=1 Tax=Tenuifilum thalassicum TaxID=2590900 RepID=A0A7D4BRA9_9BACT|nr:hypothetical protein [Tenuifilum thalassicum]QKG79501.1 hypothetical protein FHG85_04195 [Tenuifilum thalassicum]